MDHLLYYLGLGGCAILFLRLLFCQSADERKVILILLLIFGVMTWLEAPV